MQKVRSDIMTHRGSHYDLGVRLLFGYKPLLY